MKKLLIGTMCLAFGAGVAQAAEPDYLRNMASGMGQTAMAVFQGVASDPDREILLAACQDDVIAAMLARPEIAAALGNVGYEVLYSLNDFTDGDASEEQAALRVLFAEILSAVDGEKTAKEGICAVAVNRALLYDFRNEDAERIRSEVFSDFVKSVHGRSNDEIQPLVVSVAAFMRVVGNEPEAAALLRAALSNVVEAVEGRPEDRATAIGQVGSVLMDVIAYKPEASSALRAAFSNAVESIEATTGTYAAAIGTAGGALLDAIASLPEQTDALRMAFSNVVEVVSKSEADRAATVGSVGAGLMASICQKPEATDALTDALCSAFSNVVEFVKAGSTDAKAETIGRAGNQLLRTIADFPGQTDALRTAFSNVVELVATAKTDGQALAVGGTGGQLLRAIAQKPEASEKLYAAFSNVVEFVEVGETDVQAHAIGQTGESLMGAIAKLPAAYSHLMPAFSNVVESIAGKPDMQAQTLGEVGYRWLTSIVGKPEANSELRAAFSVVVESLEGKTDYQASRLSQAGFILLQAIEQKLESSEMFVEMYSEVADSIEGQAKGAAQAIGRVGAEMIKFASTKLEAVGALRTAFSNVVEHVEGVDDDISAQAIGQIGDGLMVALRNRYNDSEAVQTLQRLFDKCVACIKDCPPSAAMGVGRAGSDALECFTRKSEVEFEVPLERQLDLFLARIRALYPTITSLTALQRWPWNGMVDFGFGLDLTRLDFSTNDYTAVLSFLALTNGVPAAEALSFDLEDLVRDLSAETASCTVPVDGRTLFGGALVGTNADVRAELRILSRPDEATWQAAAALIDQVVADKIKEATDEDKKKAYADLGDLLTGPSPELTTYERYRQRVVKFCEKNGTDPALTEAMLNRLDELSQGQASDLSFWVMAMTGEDPTTWTTEWLKTHSDIEDLMGLFMTDTFCYLMAAYDAAAIKVDEDVLGAGIEKYDVIIEEIKNLIEAVRDKDYLKVITVMMKVYEEAKDIMTSNLDEIQAVFREIAGMDAKSAEFRFDDRPTMALTGACVVSNVTYSSELWAGYIGSLSAAVGYTNLTYDVTGKLDSFPGSGVTNVALPNYTGEYRLTHPGRTTSFVTFAVDGLTNRTVKLPAALAEYRYVVSNLTAGAEVEAASAVDGGTGYDLPLGDRIAIWCVPNPGFEDCKVVGRNPYVIDRVTPETEIDLPSLPKLAFITVKNVGVCSWTWHGSVSNVLEQMKRDGRYNGLQLALAPWLGIDSTGTCFGDQEGEAVWDFVKEKIGSGELNVMSTMINFPGEDYSSLESITNTMGYMYGVAEEWEDADEQWASNLLYTAEAARLTKELGVKTLTTEAGFICIDPDLMFERMCKVCAACAEYGVDILIESGPQNSLYMTNLLTRLNAAGYDNVGVNFDPGDTALFGSEDPVVSFEAMLPWVRQVHAKDCRAMRGAWNEDCPWGEGHVSKLDFGGGHAFINFLAEIGYSGNLLYERLSGDEEMTDARVAEIKAAMDAIIAQATEPEGTRRNPWYVGDDPKWGVEACEPGYDGTFAVHFAEASSAFDLSAPAYAPFLKAGARVVVETADGYWMEPAGWYARGDRITTYATPADALAAGVRSVVPNFYGESGAPRGGLAAVATSDGVRFAEWRNAETSDPDLTATNMVRAMIVDGLAEIAAEKGKDVVLTVTPESDATCASSAALLKELENVRDRAKAMGAEPKGLAHAFADVSVKVGGDPAAELDARVLLVIPWNVREGRFYAVARVHGGEAESLEEVESPYVDREEWFFVDYRNKMIYISAKKFCDYAIGELAVGQMCLVVVGNSGKALGEEDPVGLATNFTMKVFGDGCSASDFAGYCVRSKGEAAGEYAVNFRFTRTPQGFEGQVSVVPGVFTITDSADIVAKWRQEDADAGYPANGYVHVRLGCDPATGKVKGEKVYKLGKRTGSVKVSISATPAKGYVFAGWYLDPGFSQPASFVTGTGRNAKPKDYRNASQSITVTDNTYLFARFVKKSSTADPITWLRYAGAGYCGADAGYLATNEVWYQGVQLPTNAANCQVAFGSLSLPTVKVTGLPAGVKFDKRTLRFTGVPTAASTAKKPVFAVKISVKNKSGATDVLVKNVRVEPLPAWAVGTFDGCRTEEGVTNGTFTATVGKTGKFSGKVKVTAPKVTATLNAKCFSGVASLGGALHYFIDATVTYRDPATKKSVTAVAPLTLAEGAAEYAGRGVVFGEDDGEALYAVQKPKR